MPFKDYGQGRANATTEPLAPWERELLEASPPQAHALRDHAAADACAVLNFIIPDTPPVVRRALIEWAAHRLNSVFQ